MLKLALLNFIEFDLKKFTKGLKLFFAILRSIYSPIIFARKLGIKEISCYSLRHEMATYLAQVEKSDRATIKALMGWVQIIDTYFHTDTEEKQKQFQISITNIKI